ncbi:hypothetical protein LXL04_004671 [Taraxacum kok-saghyz]
MAVEHSSGDDGACISKTGKMRTIEKEKGSPSSYLDEEELLRINSDSYHRYSFSSDELLFFLVSGGSSLPDTCLAHHGLTLASKISLARDVFRRPRKSNGGGGRRLHGGSRCTGWRRLVLAFTRWKEEPSLRLEFKAAAAAFQLGLGLTLFFCCIYEERLERWIDDQVLPGGLVKTRWSKLVPRKVNIFIWRVRLARLPTRKALRDRGIDLISMGCPICVEEVETTDHLFFACPVAVDVWILVLRWLQVQPVYVRDTNTLFDWLDNVKLSRDKRDVLEAVVSTTLWMIWRYRNDVVYEGNMIRKSLLFDCIREFSFSWSYFHDSRIPNARKDAYTSDETNTIHQTFASLKTLSEKNPLGQKLWSNDKKVRSGCLEQEIEPYMDFSSFEQLFRGSYGFMSSTLTATIAYHEVDFLINMHGHISLFKYPSTYVCGREEVLVYRVKKCVCFFERQKSFADVKTSAGGGGKTYLADLFSNCRRLSHFFFCRALQMWSADCRRFDSEKTNTKEPKVFGQIRFRILLGLASFTLTMIPLLSTDPYLCSCSMAEAHGHD